MCFMNIHWIKNMSVLLIFLIVTICGCGVLEDVSTEEHTDYYGCIETFSYPYSDIKLNTYCYSKDYVDQVWPKVKEYYALNWTQMAEHVESSYDNWYKSLYNITPEIIDDLRVFEGSETIFIENSGSLCTIGGNLINMAPWDYDCDGNMDLVIASTFGSGFTFIQISVYNSKTNEIKKVCSGEMQDYMYLAVSSQQEGHADAGSKCYIHKAYLQQAGDVVDVMDVGTVGCIEYKSGEFIYKRYPE